MDNYPREQSPGFSDAALRVGIINHMRSLLESADRRDEILKDDRMSGTDNNYNHFMVLSPATEYVPVQHQRIVLTPLPRHEPVQSIEAVFLRAPLPYLDSYGERTIAGNDMFIELTGNGAQPMGRYLLNTAGLIQYESVATSRADTMADVIFNPDADFTGDFFIATEPEVQNESVLPFSLDDLARVLDQYTLVLQDNTLD